MRKLKGFVDTVIVPGCRKVKPLGNLALYVSKELHGRRERYSYFKDSYDYLKTKFIQNSKGSKWNEQIRRE